jgi:LmbE family N-acetylglucosaminyl deacetylase
MAFQNEKNVALIVAHPDDETLWAGGTIMNHPLWRFFVVCLCRASDNDRAPKFYRALSILKSQGIMGDMDDGPEQKPLNEKKLADTILNLLPSKQFDLIITHNPTGEYTRHLRHEETSKAVITLWKNGKISTDELWTFAYEDGNKSYFPRPIKTATIYYRLPNRLWLEKYSLITETYGYDKESWEAETTPKAESFWQFSNPRDSAQWLENERIIH